MDVWGPAHVSGQGHERYFLLVVDDYTRYTTVFPLRSKGEVPDVLIPWIRAVRLQLHEPFHTDLPVLRLHSDRGGEFFSDLLRDFCRGEGILQSFTLPASPQQNGIAERRIGLVVEVARTSMIHAAAPHFLWLFAVRYDEHQLNLWPRVSLPETSPTLRWTGKVADASVFRVWGARAFVRDTSADKLSSRAIPCVFLGFPPDAPGWQFYHPTTCRVLSSQDVTFDESVPFYRLFPYCTAPLLSPSPPPPPPGRSSSLQPVEVTGDSGAAGGGAARGVAPGGAESEGAEPKGAEPEVAEPGGAESEGAAPEGAEPEGAEPGGAEPEGTESGGAEYRALPLEALLLEVLELEALKALDLEVLRVLELLVVEVLELEVLELPRLAVLLELEVLELLALLVLEVLALAVLELPELVVLELEALELETLELEAMELGALELEALELEALELEELDLEALELEALELEALELEALELEVLELLELLEVLAVGVLELAILVLEALCSA
ncbi:unnamed protein product [Closterium sp. Yama58-4]|nr:unnamed protein product [Closterium sp. Yama58-4]